MIRGINWHYDRKGHLFQDRYQSEPVEDDGAYFLKNCPLFAPFAWQPYSTILMDTERTTVSTSPRYFSKSPNVALKIKV